MQSGSDSYRTAVTSGLRGPHTKIIAAWLVLRKTLFIFGTPSWVPTTRAVHFMGSATKTSGPIFKCGVGARDPLPDFLILSIKKDIPCLETNPSLTKSGRFSRD